MSRLRSTLYITAFLASTAFVCIFGLWALLLPRLWLLRLIYLWSHMLVWIDKHIGGLTYRVEGMENVPEGTCIIAAKHQSAWETCKLFLILGDCAIVLKEELTRMPVLKWYANRSGMIPIDRGGRTRTLTKMMAAARQAAAEGRRIVIFPQGTRVEPLEKRPYKSGVVALYQELNLPIIPMALNSGLFWPKTGGLKRSGEITVKFLPPIPAGLSKTDLLQRLSSELDAASDELAKL